MVSISIIGSLLINIASSVGVIMINKKLVFLLAGFNFGTVLTIIHFIVTFLGCVLFAKLGVYAPKKLRLWAVFPISCAFCGYVVFNNLSLLTNSVSVYQVSKIFCTPVIVGIEAAVYHKRETPLTLLALVPVCIGVFVTVYSSADLNAVGLFWAALAVLANSFYTIWGKTKQVELDAQPMQLLLYQAPMSAVMLIVAAPVLDGMTRLVAYEWNFTTVWTIALSCVFAFGVNFSFFLFVGKTSPLTMNVVGYLKTALVFIFDFLFVSQEASFQTLLGVTLTLVGLAMYTWAKMREANTRSPRQEDRNQPGGRSSSPALSRGVNVVIEDEPQCFKA